MMRHDFFVCDCGTTEHHIVVSDFIWGDADTLGFDPPEEITFGVHLQHGNFLERLWTGLRYIFGDKLTRPYGETILTRSKARELANLILKKVGTNEEPN